MADVTDSRWVTGPAGAGFPLAKRASNGLVLRTLPGEIPDGDVTTLEEDGPLGAAELDPPRVAPVGGGGSLDGAEGAVGELQGSHRGILHFDPLVAQLSDESGDTLHRPHQPLQKIDGVDGLVHQRPATIPASCALPAVGRVVGLVAVPFDVGVGQDDLSESSSVHGLLDGLGGMAESAGEDGDQLYPGLIGGLNNPVAPRQCDLQRLLHHHVLARLGGGRGIGHVGAGGGADVDDVHVVAFEDVPPVGRPVGPVGLSHPPGVLLAPGSRHHQPGVRDPGNGFGVEVGDKSAAHDGKAVAFFGLLCHGNLPGQDSAVSRLPAQVTWLRSVPGASQLSLP